jgi:hypothetical protein
MFMSITCRVYRAKVETTATARMAYSKPKRINTEGPFQRYTHMATKATSTTSSVIMSVTSRMCVHLRRSWTGKRGCGWSGTAELT